MLVPMNRLSREIQQALTLDRKSVPLRWTLRQLENLSKQHSKGNIGNDTSTANSIIGSKRRPCKHFSQTLINDTRIRLSKQHEICFHIIEQGRELVESTRNEMALQKSLKHMSDLEMLHVDTYSLLHQLSSNNNNERRQLSETAYDKLVFSTFEQIRSRHALTLEPLSDIISSSFIIPKVQLNALLRRRLTIQLLCDHYVWYTKYQKDTGAIYVNHNFLDLVNEAIIEAKHICDANVGYAPDVNVYLDMGFDDDDFNVTLIRTWTYHALIELLKNAMSSTVQKHSSQQNQCAPTIDMHLSKDVTKNQIICSIIDKGLGINTKSKSIKSYFEFACTKHWDRLQDQQSYAAVRAPLQGLGVGLNQSQMMMQMFGGDVLLTSNDINTMDSGCTATLILPLDTSIDEHSIQEI